jgi:alkylated DNA repair protein (DNA oxidative demethylase)
MSPDLFAHEKCNVALSPGAILLRGFALPDAGALVDQIGRLSASSPFRHMITRGGKQMSVAMLNTGTLGWVSDVSGYRYDPIDPETCRPWPPLTVEFLTLARRAATMAGYKDFTPDACLVNRYAHGARLTLHQDIDEHDLTAPIVSVSLGLTATFLWGGFTRRDRVCRHQLAHGDVVVWGGPSRMVFHGIDALKEGDHPATGSLRYNLTFRKV